MTDTLNATTVELEELNGLLVRRLVEKIKDGSATSTDLATAMNLVRSHKVVPVDPDVEAQTEAWKFDAMDYPVKV
ncbi:hypothetical protein [Actibacterium pelagium]|uniref:Uncharacterized protein n=1 Tax=Actibacterium pelagium TaxID=2029103 RepID=A0A917AEY8_9RHOB|nr:hypothetical protein [Actibacterium pelagium]GGE46821.1 hypothetical protein GCM10011517_13210 [Actibacterium pelagium]